MREFLFKGKRVTDNSWIEGGLITINNHCYILPKEIELSNETEMAPWEVIPETVSQSTYLFDKNDKQIFEGDIVRDYGFYGKHTVVGMVSFEEASGMFILTEQGYCDSLISFNPPLELEVIGNIHDNPKLMEEEE